MDEDIKQLRRDEVMSLLRDVSLSLNQAKVGTITEAIVEGYDEDEFCYVGRTSQDTPEVDGNAYIYSEYELCAGDIVSIKVIDADEYDITGEVTHEFTK